MIIVAIVIRVCPLDVIVIVVTDVVPKIRGVCNYMSIYWDLDMVRKVPVLGLDEMKLTNWPSLVVGLRGIATVGPLICRASLRRVLVTSSTS